MVVDALARSPGGRTLAVASVASGCEIAEKTAPGEPNDAGVVNFIASIDSTGAADQARWLIGADTNGPGTANEKGTLLAHTDGSIALIASLWQHTLHLDDLNDPPAIAERRGRFVARFSPELELQWIKGAHQISSPSAAPNGGLLVTYAAESPAPPVATLWRADGSSAWTMPNNCYGLESVAAAGEVFAARWTGSDGAEACDVDPGPEVVTVPENAGVSTYQF